jgi:hypothetical protein
MKKFLLAFVFLTIITITACGDKSGKSIQQSDRTPVTTDITTDITTPATTKKASPATTPKNASPAPSNVENGENTPSVPGKTSTAKTSPAQTTPAKTSPAQPQDPVFNNLYEEIREYAEQENPVKAVTPVKRVVGIPEDSDFKFEIKPDGNAKLLSFNYENENVMTVIIPTEYNGAIVDEIAGGAFCDNDTVLTVICPDTITKIGELAFAECDNLVGVQINSPACELGEELFQRSPLVMVSVQRNSDAQQYAIENGYNYNVINS